MKMKYWNEYKQVAKRYIAMSSSVDNEVGFILDEIAGYYATDMMNETALEKYLSELEEDDNEVVKEAVQRVRHMLEENTE